jgi:hypothetical protein
MIVPAQAVVPKDEVVEKARAIVKGQGLWTEGQKAVFVALMARFAGYGYVVGRIQDHFDLFRRLWDCFHAITPGSLTFYQAFLTITTSAEFISAGF